MEIDILTVFAILLQLLHRLHKILRLNALFLSTQGKTIDVKMKKR